LSRGCSLWIAVDCALKYFANEPRNAQKSTEGSSLPRLGAPSGRHSVEDPTHMTKPIRVLLLSDNESDAELISSALSRSGMSAVTSRVDSRWTFAAALSELSPDVVLSEFSSNRFDAPGAMDVMRAIAPATPLIVVTESITGAGAVTCLRAGVEDLVLKQNVTRLAASIDDAISRRRPLGKLTSRQVEVLRLVAGGNRTRDIADKLKLSVKTVESHSGELMKRLGIHDVVSLVRYAMRVGLVPAP